VSVQCLHGDLDSCSICQAELDDAREAMLPEPKPSRVRPSFARVYMGMAELLAQRSTCDRLQVGCVITSFDYRKVLSCGYNGGAAGQDNACESTEPGACGHLHAEENAVIGCDAPRSEAKIVFVTHMPCKMCAKRLVNLGGVVRLVYRTPYRITDGVAILERANVSVAAWDGS